MTYSTSLPWRVSKTLRNSCKSKKICTCSQGERERYSFFILDVLFFVFKFHNVFIIIRAISSGKKKLNMKKNDITWDHEEDEEISRNNNLNDTSYN